jgi:nitrate reductase NapE component
MKRIFIVGVALALGAGIAWAATTASKPAATNQHGLELAKALTKITGIAISPLLGVGVVGAYDYFTCPAEQKAELPWYGQVKFWLPALLIVGAIALKDSAGAVFPPGWKKAFDVLETVESKVSGLVVAGAVVPSVAMIFQRELTSAAEPALMQAGILGVSFAPLLNLLTIPLAVTCFVLVWLVGHVTNVLILISPWGVVDAALKGIRTAVIGFITALNFINPVAAALLSVAIVVVAYFIAGWSFRLMVFGSVYTWDFFTFRRKRFKPAPTANWMFTARKMEKTPIRSYGQLTKTETGALQFTYRPWLVLPARTITIPAGQYAIGRGLFYPEILQVDGEKTRALLAMPPRYKGHEEEVAAVYGISTVRDVGLLKGLKAIWNWVTGKSAVEPAIVPA